MKSHPINFVLVAKELNWIARVTRYFELRNLSQLMKERKNPFMTKSQWISKTQKNYLPTHCQNFFRGELGKNGRSHHFFYQFCRNSRKSSPSFLVFFFFKITKMKSKPKTWSLTLISRIHLLPLESHSLIILCFRYKFLCYKKGFTLAKSHNFGPPNLNNAFYSLTYAVLNFNFCVSFFFFLNTLTNNYGSPKMVKKCCKLISSHERRNYYAYPFDNLKFFIRVRVSKGPKLLDHFIILTNL